MTAHLELNYPPTLLLRPGGLPTVQERSRFLLALKYFEQGELTSGQAADLCGLERVAFLAVDLEGEELTAEFA